MIDIIWDVITNNKERFVLIDNELEIQGSYRGYKYEIDGGKEYLILGLGKDLKPNYIYMYKNGVGKNEQNN